MPDVDSDPVMPNLRVSQIFCLGATVTIRVTDNSLATKILHEKNLIIYKKCPLEIV